MDIFDAVDTKDAPLLESLIHEVNEVDDQGNTPLHYAAMNDCVPIMKILLENGADPHKKNKRGLSPLDISYEFDSDLPLYVKV